jgi:hypothetical protein
MEVFISAISVARILKVTPSAISNWQSRGTGPLPEPVAVVNGNPLWRPEQIREIVEARYAEAMAELQLIEAAGE